MARTQKPPYRSQKKSLWSRFGILLRPIEATDSGVAHAHIESVSESWTARFRFDDLFAMDRSVSIRKFDRLASHIKMVATRERPTGHGCFVNMIVSGIVDQLKFLSRGYLAQV